MVRHGKSFHHWLLVFSLSSRGKRILRAQSSNLNYQPILVANCWFKGNYLIPAESRLCKPAHFFAEKIEVLLPLERFEGQNRQGTNLFSPNLPGFNETDIFFVLTRVKMTVLSSLLLESLIITIEQYGTDTCILTDSSEPKLFAFTRKLHDSRGFGLESGVRHANMCPTLTPLVHQCPPPSWHELSWTTDSCNTREVF